MALLGAALINPLAVSMMFGYVEPLDFWVPANRVIAEVLEVFHRSGQRVDLKLVEDYLRSHEELLKGIGNVSYLTTLQEAAGTSSQATRYAQVVAEHALRRRIQQKAGVIRDLAVDLAQPVEIAVEAARELGNEVFAPSHVDEPDLTAEEFVAQRADYDWLVPGLLERMDRFIITAKEGLGKALALDTPILSDRGWLTMGEVKVGDQVYGPDGRLTDVVAVSEVLVGRPCFRLCFSDGSHVTADGEHQWRIRGIAGVSLMTSAEIGASLQLPGGQPSDHVISPIGPRRVRRCVTQVLPVRSVPVRCLQVARRDGMFLVGRSMIATHNSTVLRQLAVQFGAGIDPWTLRRIKPISVLLLDLENSAPQVSRRMHSLLAVAHQSTGEKVGPVDGGLALGGLRVNIHPQGLDLLKLVDRRWLLERLAANAPVDLLITGPIYKMHGGNPNDEGPASEVAHFLDDLRVRHNLAIMLETHSPHALDERGERALRPYGASLWMRWPEFGYGLREAKEPKVDLVPWRGARDDNRHWPSCLHRGGKWPWTIYVPNAAEEREPEYAR